MFQKDEGKITSVTLKKGSRSVLSPMCHFGRSSKNFNLKVKHKIRK
jgi:hypothetical protein